MVARAPSLRHQGKSGGAIRLGRTHWEQDCFSTPGCATASLTSRPAPHFALRRRNSPADVGDAVLKLLSGKNSRPTDRWASVMPKDLAEVAMVEFYLGSTSLPPGAPGVAWRHLLVSSGAIVCERASNQYFVSRFTSRYLAPLWPVVLRRRPAVAAPVYNFCLDMFRHLRVEFPLAKGAFRKRNGGGWLAIRTETTTFAGALTNENPPLAAAAPRPTPKINGPGYPPGEASVPAPIVPDDSNGAPNTQFPQNFPYCGGILPPCNAHLGKGSRATQWSPMGAPW